MCASAQDIVTMRNGDTIKTKVTEVNPTSVKYLIYGEESPVYVVAKDDIAAIDFESGRHETFMRGASYASSAYASDFRDIPAGIAPGMKYRQYAKLYSTSDYTKRVGDKYSPVWGGVASFVLPGLGQMVNGEMGRGFAFMGLSVACGVVSSFSNDFFSYTSDIAPIVASVALAGAFAIDIWSTIDAVKMAKIKNMYARDTAGMAALDIKMQPYFAFTAPSANGQRPVTGVTLAVSF